MKNKGSDVDKKVTYSRGNVMYWMVLSFVIGFGVSTVGFYGIEGHYMSFKYGSILYICELNEIQYEQQNLVCNWLVEDYFKENVSIILENMTEMYFNNDTRLLEVKERINNTENRIKEKFENYRNNHWWRDRYVW